MLGKSRTGSNQQHSFLSLLFAAVVVMLLLPALVVKGIARPLLLLVPIHR